MSEKFDLLQKCKVYNSLFLSNLKLDEMERGVIGNNGKTQRELEPVIAEHIRNDEVSVFFEKVQIFLDYIDQLSFFLKIPDFFLDSANNIHPK